MLPAFALRLRLRVVFALLAAAVVCMAATPGVRKLALRIGAMDMPGESRRVHTTPIPRMGGVAIFLGFLAGVLPFSVLSLPVRGILWGSLIIVALGAADDVHSLKPWVKLLGQCAAALVAIACGVRIHILTNPRIFGEVIPLGILSIPVTLVWIVGITNALNLIDGLDGLAAGVAGIGCASMLGVSLFLPGATDVSVVLGSLGGASLGFLPFNRNPAKVFMGDSGALLLGFVLSTASVLGLFKMYTVVTFAVPLLVLALPLSDTVFAIVRRLYHGEDVMKADRGHIHHRLLALGLNQKQAVAVLYAVSLIFGSAAVLLAANAAARFWLLLAAAAAVVILWLWDAEAHGRRTKNEEKKKDG